MNFAKKTATMLFLLLAGTLFLAAPGHAGVPVIDAAEVRSMIVKKDPGLLLLDVRTPGEYEQGHIAGSILIPMNDIPDRLGSIPRDRKIVVVCATGARSGAVADYLLGRGYPWVRNYAGGIMDWYRRGFQLAR